MLHVSLYKRIIAPSIILPCRSTDERGKLSESPLLVKFILGPTISVRFNAPSKKRLIDIANPSGNFASRSESYSPRVFEKVASRKSRSCW